MIRACVPEGPVVLVGHSMGGMTIMALAERNPKFFTERVAGVALVCTSAGDVMAQGLQRAVLSHRNPTVNVLGRIAHWQPRFVDRTRRLASNVIYAFVQAYSFGDRSIDPALVDPDVVWEVVDARRDAGAYTYDQPWSCLVDRREGTTAPRLHCTIGSDTLTTDLTGRPLPG